ncbi:MAG: GNAT family N-acetyltransferase [Actinomycetota bacterium]|nr:GNAT family N-acetyltransferase [Actinomycetota bacterium]
MADERRSGRSGLDQGRPAGGVLIRRAVSDDWEVIRDIRLAALADAPEAFASTLDREIGLAEADWRARIGSAVTYLAWHDGEPAGTATGLDHSGGAYPIGDAWHLVGMWVRPASRGLGIADDLVEAVVADARAAGARAIGLWVTVVNGRAQAFYRRLGFRPTGARQLVRPEEPDHWEIQLVRDLAG